MSPVLTKAELEALKDSSDYDSPLREKLEPLGFEHEGIWIWNPFWTECGRFEVADPLKEYPGYAESELRAAIAAAEAEGEDA